MNEPLSLLPTGTGFCGYCRAGQSVVDKMEEELKATMDSLSDTERERASIVLHALAQVSAFGLQCMHEHYRAKSTELAERLPGLCGWSPCPAVDELRKF